MKVQELLSSWRNLHFLDPPLRIWVHFFVLVDKPVPVLIRLPTHIGIPSWHRYLSPVPVPEENSNEMTDRNASVASTMTGIAPPSCSLGWCQRTECTVTVRSFQVYGQVLNCHNIGPSVSIATEGEMWTHYECPSLINRNCVRYLYKVYENECLTNRPCLIARMKQAADDGTIHKHRCVNLKSYNLNSSYSAVKYARIKGQSHSMYNKEFYEWGKNV
jgi:hypothetical protein